MGTIKIKIKIKKERIIMEIKIENQKLIVLLSNALCYFEEQGEDDEFIVNYLGVTVEELIFLRSL